MNNIWFYDYYILIKVKIWYLFLLNDITCILLVYSFNDN